MRDACHGVIHERFPLELIFRTAVPFGGQTTWNLTDLSPTRDSSTKHYLVQGSPPERWRKNELNTIR